MNPIIEKSKQNTLAAFDKFLERQTSKENGKFFLEADGEEKENKKEEKEENKKKESKKDDFLPEVDDDDSGKDSFDKVDDILEKFDLSKIDNNVKVELIDTIIDSLQNSTETDDEFSEIMNKIIKNIKSYKFEGEEEEKETKTPKKKKEEKEEKKEEEVPEEE